MKNFLADTANKIQTSKAEIVLQIFLVFIVPILMVNMGAIGLKLRIAVLSFIVILLLAVLIAEKWSPEMLGIKKDSFSFKKYIIPYAVFTIISVIVVSSLSEQFGREELAKWWAHKHFLYLFFVVSLFQEVAYRGYLMPALTKLSSSKFMVITVNVLLFTLLHTMFPDMVINLPLAFVGGIVFALMYDKYPSLPMIIISHAVINFCVVLYGFFVIPGVTY